MALISGGVVYPVHLLYATLLTEDEHRDTTLARLGIDKKRLLTVAKQQVLLPALEPFSGSKKARSRWN
jgi:hypothetical protein